MVEQSPSAAARRLTDTAATLRATLAEAEAALTAGDTLQAERQAKAVIALVRAARDVAELEAFGRDQPPEQDEEALRAELRRRVARFVEAARDGEADETLDAIATERLPE